MMSKILIIEDDEDINNMLQQFLNSKNYKTVSAYSGTEGLLVFDLSINLVLLDLMLPGLEGEEVIKKIKKIKDVPIIVISAIDEVDKKIDLFELGASDYVVKPFNNDELLARIKVSLKNGLISEEKSFLEYKDIKLDLNNYKVVCNNKEINFTRYEFELLKTLMEKPNQVFTKSILFEKVWDDLAVSDDNTLNVHISKIRSKLKSCNEKDDYIETVWSIGYRMKK